MLPFYLFSVFFYVIQGADALANSIQAEEPRAKRYRTSPELTEKTTLKDTGAPSDNSSDENEEKLISDGAAKGSNLKTQAPSGNLSDEKEEKLISDGAAKSSNLKTARMVCFLNSILIHTQILSSKEVKCICTNNRCLVGCQAKMNHSYLIVLFNHKNLIHHLDQILWSHT